MLSAYLILFNFENFIKILIEDWKKDHLEWYGLGQHVSSVRSGHLARRGKLLTQSSLRVEWVNWDEPHIAVSGTEKVKFLAISCCTEGEMQQKMLSTKVFLLKRLIPICPPHQRKGFSPPNMWLLSEICTTSEDIKTHRNLNIPIHNVLKWHCDTHKNISGEFTCCPPSALYPVHTQIKQFFGLKKKFFPRNNLYTGKGFNQTVKISSCIFTSIDIQILSIIYISYLNHFLECLL